MSLETFAYILAPSYSGSTLLTFLLAGSPDVATIGELKASAMGPIDDYHCSCGSLLRACPFWQKLVEELAAKDFSFDPADFGTHFRRKEQPVLDRVIRARVRGAAFEQLRSAAVKCLPEADATLARIIERNRIIAETVTQIQGGTVLLDGSKDAVRLRYLRRAGFPRIRVLFQLRDGRAVCHSAMRHDGVGMEAAALDWRKTQEEAARVLAELSPDEYLRVEYEALCRDPQGELARIAAFLGIRLDTDLTALTRKPQHILGNAMRLRSLAEIKLDEKWRTGLNVDDLATFARIAGALNRQLGYA